MAKDYVAGEIMIAFKPEAPKSKIEKVLEKYTFEKVFNNGNFSNSNDIKGKVLDRLYSLTVNPGTEAAVLEGLKIRYGNLIEYAELPTQRKIME